MKHVAAPLNFRLGNEPFALIGEQAAHPKPRKPRRHEAEQLPMFDVKLPSPAPRLEDNPFWRKP